MVLQNPGGATGNLGGAATQRRRSEFRKEVARQTQSGTSTTNNANPVAQQLLLAPTFLPVQANAVLDQTNMRIAVPVRQVDGEYILTMKVMGAAGAGAQTAQPAAGGAQPTAGQTPTAAAPAAGSATSPKPAGEAPAGEAPAGEAPAASPKASPEAAKPSLEGQGASSNGTATARPERRQESDKDKYGNPKPPMGYVIMTMKEIDAMADAVTWGGQPAITKMMSEYVKAQTGKDSDPIQGGSTDAGAKLVAA